MTTKDLVEIFKENTKLKSSEIDELMAIIVQFDEPIDLVYEAIGLLKEKIPFKKVLDDYSNKRFGYRGTFFKKQQIDRKINDNILAKPPQIREGEIPCPKCGKNKTLVVEMQTRSLDEGFTYSIHCLNEKCKKITK